MDSTNLGRRLINLVDKIHNIDFSQSGDADDRKHGIDGWLDGDIPCAVRKRNIKSTDYGGRTITIRCSKPGGQGYIDFEYDKLLNGKFRAVLYFFRFTDCLILCPVESITNYLQSKTLDRLDVRKNTTGHSDLITIHPDELDGITKIEFSSKLL